MKRRLNNVPPHKSTPTWLHTISVRIKINQSQTLQKKIKEITRWDYTIGLSFNKIKKSNSSGHNSLTSNAGAIQVLLRFYKDKKNNPKPLHKFNWRIVPVGKSTEEMTNYINLSFIWKNYSKIKRNDDN